MRVDRRQTLWLLCILLFGLLLRFTYAVDHSTLHAFASDEGGDSGWYLANGAGFFSGKPTRKDPWPSFLPVQRFDATVVFVVCRHHSAVAA